ncbi:MULTISPECIES: ferritin-like domain-containing protein [Psychrilyobacter]|nr:MULTISPECIES: DUF2202 domain-containing protein [Psychrilyobacter]MCS5420718.1 DUF2202 domain-containing protein [Psychrilyobacter sp. S5]NDI78006.1 DUF2202 domain-containing protein [Psychrilyobacter piezotolerans]
MKSKFIGILMMLVLSSLTFGSYGHLGAEKDRDMTVQEMIKYAIEDEIFAKTEYEKIMKTFNIDRPFSNIKRAEETHIELLQPLIEKYNVSYDKLDEKSLVIPKTLKETFEIGVQAEIDNIAMYEKFLKDEKLPADVREVFTHLRDGSKNHLRAFERQLRKY